MKNFLDTEELDKIVENIGIRNKEYSNRMSDSDREKEFERVKKAIHRCLKPQEREEAEERAKSAINLGWHKLGFLEGWSEDAEGDLIPDEPTLDDLFGISPKTGYGDFIKDHINVKEQGCPKLGGLCKDNPDYG